MTRRFFAWLIRPQCTPLTVAAAFLAGTFSGSWQARLVAAFSVGVAWAVVTAVTAHLLHRRARTQ